MHECASCGHPQIHHRTTLGVTWCAAEVPTDEYKSCYCQGFKPKSGEGA